MNNTILFYSSTVFLTVRSGDPWGDFRVQGGSQGLSTKQRGKEILLGSLGISVQGS